MRGNSRRTRKTKFDRPSNVQFLDKHIEQILTETAAELNLNYETVRKAFMHFLNWNRTSFTQLNYYEYLWPRFGSFFLIAPKRSSKSPVIIDKITKGKNKYNTLKDSNRKFKQQDIDNALQDVNYADKKKVIDEICTYHPSIIQLKRTCIVKYRHYAWWVGGRVQEGEWNQTTMLLESIDDLKKFLECLKDLNSKLEYKYKPL